MLHYSFQNRVTVEESVSLHFKYDKTALKTTEVHEKRAEGRWGTVEYNDT